MFAETLISNHRKEINERKKILTQTEVSCCPVAVQLRIQFNIFAFHLDSFRVEVNGVAEILASVFIIAFFLVHLCNS